jgi:hypothetical protein
LELPLYGYGSRDTFYAKSVVSKNAEPLNEEQLESFWRFVTEEGVGAEYPWFSIANLYGGFGSQINVPKSDDSASSDSDALWVFQVC